MQQRLNLLALETNCLAKGKKTLKRFIQNSTFLERNLKIIIPRKWCLRRKNWRFSKPFRICSFRKSKINLFFIISFYKCNQFIIKQNKKKLWLIRLKKSKLVLVSYLRPSRLRLKLVRFKVTFQLPVKSMFRINSSNRMVKELLGFSMMIYKMSRFNRLDNNKIILGYSMLF